MKNDKEEHNLYKIYRRLVHPFFGETLVSAGHKLIKYGKDKPNERYFVNYDLLLSSYRIDAYVSGRYSRIKNHWSRRRNLSTSNTLSTMCYREVTLLEEVELSIPTDFRPLGKVKYPYKVK